jgi:hypothetical protein
MSSLYAVGEVNKNHLLNRLEDLQENMADFEHNFCTQYKVKRDFGDRCVPVPHHHHILLPL